MKNSALAVTLMLSLPAFVCAADGPKLEDFDNYLEYAAAYQENSKQNIAKMCESAGPVEIGSSAFTVVCEGGTIQEVIETKYGVSVWYEMPGSRRVKVEDGVVALISS